MKAYLIDPFALTVAEVEHDGDARDILRQIRADSLDTVNLGVAGGVIVTAYVDDGGYYVADQAWWRFAGNDNPLPGRALVVGVDYMGDIVGAPVTQSWLLRGIVWLGQERPHLPDIVVRTVRGERRIDMNGPDAPRSREEAASRINQELGKL